MHRVWTASVVLAVAAGGIAIAADLQSGLQVGEHAGAYNVKDITGPDKGRSLCLR
jgi:hypothetical protein